MSRPIAPMMEQVPLDKLEPVVIVPLHVEALEGGDLVQLVEKLAPLLVRDPALDEGDPGETEPPGHRFDFVHHRRRVDDRRAGREPEADLPVAELDAKRAAFVAGRIGEEDGAAEIAAYALVSERQVGGI